MVDLPGVVVAPALAVPAGTHPVRRVRVAHRPRPAPVVRVVVELDSPCAAEMEPEDRSLRVRLRSRRIDASSLGGESAPRR